MYLLNWLIQKELNCIQKRAFLQLTKWNTKESKNYSSILCKQHLHLINIRAVVKDKNLKATLWQMKCFIRKRNNLRRSFWRNWQIHMLNCITDQNTGFTVIKLLSFSLRLSLRENCKCVDCCAALVLCGTISVVGGLHGWLFVRGCQKLPMMSDRAGANQLQDKAEPMLEQPVERT